MMPRYLLKVSWGEEAVNIVAASQSVRSIFQRGDGVSRMLLTYCKPGRIMV